ncbi:MAG: AMP-binding protein [Acidobacteriota bacterium]
MQRTPERPDFFAQFRRNLAERPDQVAFQHLGREGKQAWTYADVARETRAVAAYLRSVLGEPGRHVGILMENHPRWGIAFLAIQSCGGVVVPFDVLHPADVLRGLVDHSQCDWLMVSDKYWETARRIQASLDRPVRLLRVGSGTETEEPTWEAVLREWERSSHDDPIPLVSRGFDDPLVILYTSGTTGNPKGVVLSERNLYRTLQEGLKVIQVTPDDHFLGVLPLYHIFALMVNFIAPLWCGARATSLEILEAQRILQTCREEGITIFSCIPQFFHMMDRRLQAEVARRSFWQRWLFRRLLAVSWQVTKWTGRRIGRRLFPAVHRPFGPRLRFFGVGGARFDPETARRLTALGFTVVQAYGMTETAALATLTPLEPAGVGSVGRPLPHNELRVVPAPGPEGEEGIGEVLIRGEGVTREYYRNPEATREAIDADGWLHTGDLGRLDAEGFLHLTGRAKDVIVLASGKNVYPEEIEHFYQSRCSLIGEICVLGLEDPDTGEERLHAVVVPDFEELKRQKVVHAYNMIRYLMETISQQLPAYQRVRSLEIWQEPLPRTPTRKIRRHEVLARVREGARGDEAGTAPAEWKPSDAVEEQIVALLREVKRVERLDPAMNLELDVGLESLERVEFLASVAEAYGLEIPDEDAAGLFTLGDVIEYVRRRQQAPAPEVERKTWAEILDEPLGPDAPQEYLRILRRRPLVEPLVLFVAWAVRWIGRIFFRLRGEGLENIPQTYPFLICPNHLSYLDSFFVVSLLPNRVVRRFFSLAYSDYVSQGVTRFLGSLVRAVPVNADRNLRQTLRLAAEGLRRDLVLLVFPEGERSIDGTLKAFRKGPAILATHLGLPVVPVGIRGSYEAWPRGSNRIRFHPITIRFGAPIRPEPGESIDQFNERLRQAVAALL